MGQRMGIWLLDKNCK